MFLFALLLFWFVFGLGHAQTCSEDFSMPVRQGIIWNRILNDPNDPHHAEVIADRNLYCAELTRESVDENGFLDFETRRMLCSIGCGFAAYCESAEEVSVYNFTKVIETLMNYDAMSEDPVLVKSKTVTEWFDMLKRTSPILYTIIPILLKQYQYYGFSTAISLNIVGILAMYCYGVSFVQLAFVVVVSVACLVSDNGKSPIKETFGSYVFMLSLIFMTFFVSIEIQLFTGITAVMFYVWYIKTAFVDRRHGSQSGIMILLLQAMVMAEQVRFIRIEMRSQSLGLNFIEMTLNAIIPDGHSAYYFKNSAYLSRVAVSHFSHGIPQVYGFLSIFLIQIAMFLIFRALLGMFIIISLRYRFSLANVGIGFVVYAGDLFGGIQYLLRVLFGIERADSRRLVYAFVNVFGLTIEYMSAREFFALRIIILLIDKFILTTSYSKLPRYLSIPVDFRGQSFPIVGAKSWVSLEELYTLSSFVRRVKVQTSKGSALGTGILRKPCRRNQPVALLTVQHLVEDSYGLSLDDGKFKVVNPVFTCFNQSVDPVGSLVLEGYEGEGADFQLLADSELIDIKQCFFLNIDDSGNRMLNAVDSFHYDQRTGDLRATVNLKKGDSGAPVFASMVDGSLRYVGCVSRGDVTKGSGNYISFIVGYHISKFDSDSDSVKSDLDKPNVTQSFNRDREASRVDMKLGVQRKMMELSKKIGAIIIDASKDKAEWVDDHFEIESDDYPDHDSDDEKRREYKINSRKRRKKDYRRKTRMVQTLIGEIENLAEIIFDDNELGEFMKYVRKGRVFTFSSNNLVRWGHYGSVEASPDPSDEF